MGLSSSKAHPKVTKVAPMCAREDLPALTTPYWLPSMPGQPTLHPPATMEWGKPSFHQQLPPLRETWYGRASSGPLSFNTVPEKGETSIIKQHPPRRPQRLEPAGPSQAIAPAQPWRQQETAASPKLKLSNLNTHRHKHLLQPQMCKWGSSLQITRLSWNNRPKEALEKKGQSLRHLPGRRQHLHKLQMLDLTRRRREAELKRNLHREAKINKQKIKEFSPKKVLDTLQRGDSTESQDLVPAEHNQRFHGDDCGNTQGEGLPRQHDDAELSPGRNRKVDLWFCKEPQMRDLFWDTSSTSSEEWEREERIRRKPTLVRTKTERVSLFDDFFDKDF